MYILHNLDSDWRRLSVWTRVNSTIHIHSLSQVTAADSFVSKRMHIPCVGIWFH